MSERSVPQVTPGGAADATPVDGITWAVFSKPWPMLAAEDLAGLVSRLGFTAIELPVRKGFQVSPDRVQQDLPEFRRALADAGVAMVSIAAEPDAAAFDACAAAEVPLIRIMLDVGADGMRAAKDMALRRLERWEPLAQRSGVGIGIQPHHGRYLSSTSDVLRIAEHFDPAVVSVIWDAAHAALAGEETDLSLGDASSRLSMVNLKNALYEPLQTDADVSGRRANADGPVPAGPAEWRTKFVPGPTGLADWSTVATELRRLEYSGPICLSAQYDGQDDPAFDLETVVTTDLRYAKCSVVRELRTENLPTV